MCVYVQYEICVITFLVKMRYVAFYSYRRLVCMCMYVRLVDHTKRFEINPPFFNHLVGYLKRHPRTYTAMPLLTTLIYLLKVKDSNQDYFSILNVVISQTVTDRANITIVNTGSCLLAFDWYVYI